jgi:hypothetical protein
MLAVLLFFAGCAPAGTTSPSVSVIPSGSAVPSSAASRTAATASPSAPADGRVSVVVDRDNYTPGEPIEFLVGNGLDGPIATVDQQAFCSILRLDQEVNGAWQEIHNCLSGPPPREVIIGPGDEQTVIWQGGLGKGVYRARLVFTIGEAFAAGTALEVVSGRLTVG